MSSILRALVGAATVLAVSGAAPLMAQGAPSTQHFAYVNTNTILNAAPGRAEAEAQLQKEAAGWEAELKKMQDQMTAMVADFQKKSGTMTAAERDKQTAYIQGKQAEFQKRNDSINAVADRRRSEMLQPILDQVKIALEDVRKSAGLDVIFDIGQNGTTIVAIDKNLDISDRVIARLRVLGPPVPVKAETPAGPATKPVPTKPSGLPIAAPSGIGRPRVDTNTVKPASPRK